jgi:hypothetical protein
MINTEVSGSKKKYQNTDKNTHKTTENKTAATTSSNTMAIQPL